MNVTYLSGTAVIPQDFTGVIRVRSLSWDQFCRMAAEATSAIGHQGTVDALVALGVPCILNRVQISGLVPGDRLLVWQPRQRLPEGVVLSAEQLTAIGCICRLIEVLDLAAT